MKTVRPLYLYLVIVCFLQLLTSIHGINEGDSCKPSDPDACEFATTGMTCVEVTPGWSAGYCICPTGSYLEADECRFLYGSTCPAPTPTAPDKCIINSKYVEGTGRTWTCDCDSGYKPSAANKCVKDLDGECTLDSDCDQSKFHSCLETSTPIKKCGCNETIETYNEVTGECTIFAGDTCKPEVTEAADRDLPTPPSIKKCTTWSQCHKNYEDSSYKCHCATGLQPRNGHCRAGLKKSCDVTEKLNPDCYEGAWLRCGGDSKCSCWVDHELKGEECVAKYGIACGTDKAPCNDAKFQECGVNGKCACKNPSTSIYDQDNGQCFTPIGQDCNPQSHSVCVDNGNCTNGICTCPNGLEGDKNGRCVIPYGQNCIPGNDTVTCNPDKFLTCDPTERTCMCGENSWTDSDDKPCVLKAAADCSLVDDGTQPKCGPDSTCQRKEEGTSPTGVCTCNEGFYASSTDQKCYVKPGQACTVMGSGSDRCNSADFQSCDTESGKCGCSNSTASVLEPDFQCRLRANAACSATTPNGQQCTQNSQCSDSKCACEDTYVANGAGKCVHSFGSSCDQTATISCDDQFVCLNGNCTCHFPTEQEYVNNVCVGMKGARCNPAPVGEGIVDIKCGANMKCVEGSGENYPYNGTCTCNFTGPNGDCRNGGRINQVTGGLVGIVGIVVAILAFR